MTFSAGSGKVSYSGDGSTTAFPTTFKFIQNSHVKAILRDANGVETTWVESTNYTLTGKGNPAGGTLTATVAPASGETLVIILDVPFTQEKAFPLGGAFPSTQVEEMGDLNSMQSAKLSEVDARTLKVPETDTQVGSNLDIPIDSVRAGKFLAFDGVGKPIVAAGTSANLGPVTAFIDTLLDDPDAVTARATLFDDLLTANGDIIVRLSGALARLAAGSEGDVLQIASGLPAWDASSAIPTGSLYPYIGATAPVGWLLAQGGTIGNGSSGGTAQANSDTESLFTLIWDSMADAEAPVSSGRGASAAADFAADKTIKLPDLRGRSIIGSGTGPDTAEGGGAGSARTHGAKGGVETHVQTITELAAHSHAAGSTDGLQGGVGQSRNPNASGNQTSVTGSSVAMDRMHPWQALNHIVKL